ncbi:MAG: adenylyltransferase/cytidyltransferase family protein [Candidatus Bathyarchaeia archaeon]|jgi:FAD synthetase
MANKSRKKKVVLASGIFDLLHLGHVKFLEDAKKAGGENAKLIVIVARDITVEKTKGRKPIMSEDQRLSLVESLKVVDEAVLGFEHLDIGGFIEKIKPDVIALGYDQEEMEKRVSQYVTEHNLDLKIVRIGKFEADDLGSSSKIREKIVENWRSRRNDHYYP